MHKVCIVKRIMRNKAYTRALFHFNAAKTREGQREYKT